MSDAVLEQEAQAWIEQITGMPFEGQTFAESLKDGVLLCTLANKIKPGSIATVNKSKLPFKCMENISNFLKFLRSQGMKEFELFGTPDLWDEKNIKQVVKTLFSYGGHLQSTMPDLPFPKLGIKVQEKQTRVFTEKQLTEARMAVSVLNLGSSDMAKKASDAVLGGTGFKLSPQKDSVSAEEPLVEESPAPESTKRPPPPRGPLPAGWEECISDEGQYYYYNTVTEESVWEYPTSPA